MAKRQGNYKPGPGRPKGSKGTPRAKYGKYPVQRCVRMTQEQLDHLMSKYGDASIGVRALIDADIAKESVVGTLGSEVSQKE